jgi:hypothetical protein
MTNTLGHVAVSASFDPIARAEGKLVYQTEAEQLRAADPQGVYQTFTFALNPDAAQDCVELAAQLRRLGFDPLRGIVSGIELCDASSTTQATAALIRCLELAVELGMQQVFCVAQEWPAGSRTADFEQDILPPFVANVQAALHAVPAITEFGVEPLIPVEQQHVNTLAKARRLANACNQALGARRVYPVPDLAHLYGLVERTHWDAITDQLIEAIQGGEVPYAHLSVPESRTDQFLPAIAAGDLPERAVRALRQVPCVDTEAFDPNDRFLGDLRRLVPRFASADPSGWTEGKRFDRFVETAQYFQGLA